MGKTLSSSSIALSRPIDPMKILIVGQSSIFDNLGGSEMQIQQLCKYLVENGHSVVFYFHEYLPDHPDRFERHGAAIYQDTRHHCCLTAPLFQLRRLAKVIIEERPALLYARCIQSLFLIRRTAEATGVPFVYHVPFQLTPELLTFGHALATLRKTKWKCLTNYLSLLAIKHASTLLCVSNEEKTVLADCLGREAKTIYNMHPIPDVPRKKASPPVVVWINNIKLVKQPGLFVDLAARCHDTKARFVMSGSMRSGRSAENLRQRIEATRNLDYIGPTTLDEANALLAEATVNVVTSKREGFPNGSIQGWLRETPTITTVDKDQVITRNKIGFHVSSVDEMEEKLRFLLDNPQTCEEMGKRAREYAINHHDIETIGKQYLEVFNSVIDNRHSQ